jgi:hypothetical protein
VPGGLLESGATAENIFKICGTFYAKSASVDIPVFAIAAEILRGDAAMGLAVVG